MTDLRLDLGQLPALYLEQVEHPRVTGGAVGPVPFDAARAIVAASQIEPADDVLPQEDGVAKLVREEELADGEVTRSACVTS